MIVPIKGIDPNTEVHLKALVNSKIDVPVEFLFATESPADPAYEICQRIKHVYPQKDIRIVITGTANERMGKQHNLSEAVKQAKYEIIGSMDADVYPEPNSLILGLHQLNKPDTGVAFSLPYYYGFGQIGGTLVALYTNYYFSLYIGSLVIGQTFPLTIGSLWFIAKETLAKIGGLEQFTFTVSDDAAIGKAVVRHGLRNIPIVQPVKVAFEQLDLQGGFKHLQKWVAMLRAEGLARFLLICLTWHFVWLSLITSIVGVVINPERLGVLSLGLMVTSVITRMASVLGLNRTVYAQVERIRFLFAVVLYELLVVPILFGIGLFKRTLVWRGRKYVIRQGGKILLKEDKTL